ncbi:MAG: OadG family protein [Lentimicrobiaceae bacterium]|jgi:Na+-transporting methylmalonyl-CoA/oxaloacetate decarboxylase gamma subunit|nr:OadG family protein [Lentimicrobiaceae bacterium]
MKKKLGFIGITLLLVFAFAQFVVAQNNEQVQEIIIEKEAYDPLIPQMFVFDKENNIFAGLNNADNTVDLIRYDGEKLEIFKSILVDVVAKRHDVEHIYRPKGIAIYENHLVFLASHRDSCYLSVINLTGESVKKLYFAGSADAFSYNSEAKELYVAGETATGYDLIALNTSNGIDKIDLGEAVSLHYRQPRLADEIAKKDPAGVGISSVAILVVFLSLLLLAVIFKSTGKFFISSATKNEKKINVHVAETQKGTSDVSGEVYAAIFTAIHLYNEELHDLENTVLTINKVSRTYSPWSSKIHGLNTYFNNIGYKK